MKSENINRFKETLIVLCFLAFLFSFSGRSFGRSDEKPGAKQLATACAKTSAATFISNTSLKAPFHRPVLKSNFELNRHFLMLKFENNKLAHVLSALHYKHLSIKPRISSAFYYRLFSLSGEVPD